MKNPPRRAPLMEEPAHQEDITPKIGAGTEPRAYRRTTVTVERETLSVLARRTVAEPVAANGAHPGGSEIGPEPQDESPPGSSPPNLLG